MKNKWFTEKDFFELSRDRTSCHKWSILSGIIAVIAIGCSCFVFFGINNLLGLFILGYGIYWLILFTGFIDKRDLYSFFIYLKSKEEK